MQVSNEIATTTILLAIASYVGYQARNVPGIVWKHVRNKFVFTANINQSTDLFEYFDIWLSKHYGSKFRNIQATIGDTHRRDAGRKFEEGEDTKNDELQIYHHQDIFFLKMYRKNLIIKRSTEKLQNVSDIQNLNFVTFTIEGWLAKEAIMKLLDDVVAYNNSIKIASQFIYTNNKYGDWYRIGEVKGKNLDKIFLKNKDIIINDISEFVAAEEWYANRGLLWKRGYLLYGPPGNGKTSLCLAIAAHLNYHIQFININDFQNDGDMLRAFTNLRNKSIMVIEDCDSVIANKNNQSNVSFSAFLNCMDGAFSKYGLITILTTNHIDKLDSASIREGRIDMRLEIPNPDREIVSDYMSHFYGKHICVEDERNISMAKVQEICLLNKDNSNEAIKHYLCANNQMVHSEVEVS